MFKCFIKNEISDEDYRKYKKFSYQVGDEEYTVLFKETDEIFTYDIECLKPEKYKGDILLRLTIDEQYIKDNLEYILRKMKDTDETKEKLQGETRLHIAIHQMYKIIAELEEKRKMIREKIKNKVGVSEGFAKEINDVIIGLTKAGVLYIKDNREVGDVR